MEGPGTHETGGSRDALVRSALGRWIRNHRKTVGLSQAGLLRRLESRGISVSQSAISRWESGDSAPPVEVLPALTECLGTTLASAEEILARAARADGTVDLTGRSVDDLRADGERAARAGNFPRALALLEAALDLLALDDSPAEPAEEARILLLLAWVHYNLWHLELARQVLRRIGDLPGLPDHVSLRRRLFRVVLEHRYGDDETAMILAAHVEDQLDSLQGSDRAWARHTLGQFRFTIEEYAAATRLLAGAREEWFRLGNQLEATRAGCLLGYCRALVDETASTGEALLRDVIDTAERSGYRDITIQGQRLLGRLLLTTGRRDEGMTFLENAMTAARLAALPEEEFLAAFYAWQLLQGDARDKISRRLRRLLLRVHPMLPEARQFLGGAPTGNAAGREDDR